MQSGSDLHSSQGNAPGEEMNKIATRVATNTHKEVAWDSTLNACSQSNIVS